MSSHTVLDLSNVVKRYPGVVALKSVSLQVSAGEVHAIVGENGAGKSTLMGVACGAIEADEGQVTIGGQLLRRASPALAQELGLAIVYQHASVLEDLTVAENMVYAVPDAHRPARGELNGWVRHLLAAVGATARPNARISDLSIAQRQLVELARALAVQARVLVLDEPTESLTAAETELLFTQIRQLRAAGTGIVYISHRFGEVRRISDRITVLRDGESRGTMRTTDVSEEQVVTLIVGRQVDHLFPHKSAPTGPARPLLSANAVSGPRFSGVSLDVSSGEIVGMAGIEGNGQREFLRTLAGLVPHRGSVRAHKREGEISSPATAVRSGVVYLPADRHLEGAFLPLSVAQNVSALLQGKLSSIGVLRPRSEGAIARRMVSALDVRTPSVATPVSALSGGNQQKVLIARSLAADPDVILADEPTRGVDVGARVEIYRTLREFADDGHAAVIVSSDAIELAGLCDRVQVFSRGKVVRELSGDDLTEREITRAAIGATETLDGPDTRRKLPSVLRGDYFPSLTLSVMIVLLAIYTTARSSSFLGERSIANLTLLASIVIFVALGQLTVMLVGSIDLSVGPLVGLVVVIMSFFASGGHGLLGLALGTLVALAAGAAVGVLNAVLIRGVKLPSVVATLVTYILLQGISLLLRSKPGGYIDSSSTDFLQRSVGPIPYALVIAVLVTIGAELFLRRTRPGIGMRAVGSDEVRARQVGAPVWRTFLWAHVVCSLGAVLGGVVLVSVVGVGDPSLGTNYTLIAVAAVVLGGASIFGGRGSYIGALLAALLLQEVTNATTFLNLSGAWQQGLPGLLILLGAAVFSGGFRKSARAALAA